VNFDVGAVTDPAIRQLEFGIPVTLVAQPDLSDLPAFNEHRPERLSIPGFLRAVGPRREYLTLRRWLLHVSPPSLRR